MSDGGENPRQRLADVLARLDELAETASELRAQTSRNDKERARLQAERVAIETRIAASRDSITVSDHAVIRYLERRYGFDFENVRNEILSPAVRSAVNLGAAGVKIDGGTFKIAGKTITTFFTPK